MLTQYRVFDSLGRWESLYIYAVNSFEARREAAAEWGCDYLDCYATAR